MTAVMKSNCRYGQPFEAVKKVASNGCIYMKSYFKIFSVMAMLLIIVACGGGGGGSDGESADASGGQTSPVTDDQSGAEDQDDNDQDGTSNNVNGDDDKDNDGIDDDIDNCPLVSNIDQQDYDFDKLGDACDTDDDNDGVGDNEDAFPLDTSESADTDGDGIGDNVDTDNDNDGVEDPVGTFVEIISDMDWLYEQSGHGGNVRNQDNQDDVLNINGQEYYKGVAVYPHSVMTVALDERYHTFKADLGTYLGVNASAQFHVYLDNEKAYTSEITYQDIPTIHLTLDVTGAREMTLEVTDGGNGGNDRVIWGNALLVGDIPASDHDLDGVADDTDTDTDNDGVLNYNDALPFDQTASVDTDGDGIRDGNDIFPNDATNGENFEIQHPGVFLSQEMLDDLVASYNAGERDDIYNSMMHYKADAIVDNCNPPTHIAANSDGSNNDIKNMYVTCATAANRYVNDFILTGNAEAEQNVIALFNKFSAVESYTPNGPSKLVAGIHIGHLYHAADLLRSWGTSWPQSEQDDFSEATRRLFVDDLKDYSVTFGGNWQLAEGYSLLAIAVWLDDKALFLETVRHFHQSSPIKDDARLDIYLLPNGQNHESTRDQLHAQMGILAAAQLAQIAFNQGIDLWEGEHYSIGRAFEHFALYNFENIDEVPFQMHTNTFHPNGSATYGRETHMSTDQRGHSRAVWNMVHHHYTNYRGTDFPEVKKKSDNSTNAPGSGTEMYGGLYFKGLAGLSQTHDAVDTSVTLISDQIDKLPLIALNLGGGIEHDNERRVVFVQAASNYHLVDGKDSEYKDGYIANTQTPEIYRTNRYGLHGESLGTTTPVPNGNYMVRLHFAELERRFAGARRFDVLVEDDVVADDLDVVEEVGPQAAYILEVPVIITDGMLNVDLKRYDWDTTNESVEEPMIAALEVVKLD
ncbi:MAG TPA: hypothetical protein ENI05_04755 [Porticoccus sp.]|nr:hypothetical protein [Porticoccus sp.]